MTIVQSDSIRSKSHLPFLGEFSWVKSSHFNKNPCIQEFHLRVKGFPMQILQRVGVGHLNSLLNLKVTSVWAVLHTSLYYWKWKNFQNENFLIIYSPPCHPRCSCLSFFGCKEIVYITYKQNFWTKPAVFKTGESCKNVTKFTVEYNCHFCLDAISKTKANVF